MIFKNTTKTMKRLPKNHQLPENHEKTQFCQKSTNFQLMEILYNLCSRNEARAATIAREIEGSSTSQNQIELENGDEEEAFSAVVRPSQQQQRGEFKFLTFTKLCFVVVVQ